MYLPINIFLVGASAYQNFDSESINRNGIHGSSTRVEGKDLVTWCTVSIAEQQKCEYLAKNATLDKGLFGKDFIEIECKQV